MSVSKRAVFIVIIFLVFFVTHEIFAHHWGVNQRLEIRLGTYSLIGGLSFFFMLGEQWARWMAVILLEGGGLLEIIRAAIIWDHGSAASRGRFIGYLVMALVCLALALYLAFAKSIIHEFTRPKRTWDSDQ